MDVVGWVFLELGTELKIVTGVDDHSRYAVAAGVVERATAARVCQVLIEALRQHGVPDPAASLTAEAGIAVFKIAFERWISLSDQQDLPQYIREAVDELKAVTAGK